MMKKLMIILLGGFCVGGCNPLMIVRPNSEHLLQKGWAKPPCQAKNVPPLYCYKTIGEVMCYPYPQVGLEKRLSGYYGPTP